MPFDDTLESSDTRQQIALARSYVAGQVSAAEFGREYLLAWQRSSTTQHAELLGDVLNEIFYDVDAVVADGASLIPDFHEIDPEELRRRVKAQLDRLDGLSP